MTTITTRAGKGEPLTHPEVDANFTNLNTDKLESGDTAASLTITTADINGGTIDGTVIGGSTPAAISGTTGTFSGDLTVDTNTLFVDASSNRVGIETSSPAYELEVYGRLHSYIDGTGDQTSFGTTTSGGGGYSIKADDYTAANPVWQHNVNFGEQFAWRISSFEAMRIDSSGNAGFGSSSTLIDGLDARVLAQTNASATNSAFAAYHPTAVGGRSVASFFSNKGSVLTKVAEINTGGDAFFDGSVGIGTSSPLDKLTVDGGIGLLNSPANLIMRNGNSNGFIDFDAPEVSTAGIGVRFFRDTNTTGDRYVRFHTGDGTASTDHQITCGGGSSFFNANGGNVGIGTSSPVQLLHLSKSGIAGMRIEDTDAAGGYVDLEVNGSAFFIDSHDEDGTKGLVLFRTAGTETMRIDSSGSGSLLVGTTSQKSNEKLNVSFNAAGGDTGIELVASGNVISTQVEFWNNTINNVGSITTNNSATSYNTSSDYRLKENVVPLAGAADRLAQIPVHRFNFIADPDKTVDGFLAHEVQAFVPEAVTGEKDAVDKDGNPKHQGIDQSKLVPLLTAALQEALTEIASLKARLDAANL